MFVDRDQRISNIWTTSPIRPYHLRSGPRSAFARLFPEQYRREQETTLRQQRFSSEVDLKDCCGKIKHSRVTFSTTGEANYGVRTKSEPQLADIECHKADSSSPRPKLIYQVGSYRLLCIPRVDARYLRPIVFLPRPFSSTPSEYRSETISRESIRNAPRRVVNQRLPPLPTRPRSVIFDKWLSYKAKVKQMASLPLSQAPTESHYDVPRVYDDNPWIRTVRRTIVIFAKHHHHLVILAGRWSRWDRSYLLDRNIDNNVPIDELE